MSLLAFIPSPSKGVIDLGPLHVHMYGLMLLLAIAAAIWLTGKRWVKLGGDWDLVLRVAVWGSAARVEGLSMSSLQKPSSFGIETGSTCARSTRE